MDQQLASLIAASIAFAGGHFALSHPLRGAVQRVTGEKGFQAVYSLVALAAFAWMVLAFRATDPGVPLWNGTGDPAWALASLIMLVASVLLVGSFAGNPAMPTPNAAELAARPPRGVFQVTRHPMMWAMALWSLAHVMVSPVPRVIVLGMAIAVLALVGSHLQDRKKEVLMGAAWAGWEKRTSFWPRPAGLARAGTTAWIGGVVLWLAASWAHIPGNGIAAGIWRWLVA